MPDVPELLKEIDRLRKTLRGFVAEKAGSGAMRERMGKRLVDESRLLIGELHRMRERVSPVRIGAIGITLGRSDSIAKFFAFSFTNQEKRPLHRLTEFPFYGSGVYAIYYHGKTQKVYRPISGTETPIYVGKANPNNPQAETVEEQGQAIFRRLKEHSRSMVNANLPLKDFFYRASPIQTGMQAAVEDFMIRLFRPAWNKEIRICYGIGKHGDSAQTRQNRRSPWDTMHPGRAWAADTKTDQMKRREIKTKIENHFKTHPVIPDKDKLFKLLALE